MCAANTGPIQLDAQFKRLMKVSKFLRNLCFILLLTALQMPWSSAHTCLDGICEKLETHSCEHYFNATGRTSCNTLCSLSANELCSGFTKNLFSKIPDKDGSSESCKNGILLDDNKGWRINFDYVSDEKNSKLYWLDIVGPSKHLGKWSSNEHSAERYYFTFDITPNWNYGYALHLQLYAGFVNKKGFNAILVDNNRDTKPIPAEIYDEVDNLVLFSIRSYFDSDQQFSDCNLTNG